MNVCFWSIILFKQIKSDRIGPEGQKPKKLFGLKKTIQKNYRVKIYGLYFQNFKIEAPRIEYMYLQVDLPKAIKIFKFLIVILRHCYLFVPYNVIFLVLSFLRKIFSVITPYIIDFFLGKECWRKQAFHMCYLLNFETTNLFYFSDCTREKIIFSVLWG